ncbi:AP-5 complex subunit sigma-1 isoform X1 [Cololabis saira]|uniref:AP-5 complex subunit sigma-1 isoform X1 n=1 Tax=Cololabis saira TaxID=129043 RepID=UPI002AD4C7F6|nr:AP-5 complex subunit sigma-1 isoform X1 [Cololabis saira]
MVLCFLIHTACAVGGLSPGESRVLYSRVFGPDGALGERSPEQRRLLRREKLAVVARQVRSAVSLSREASGKVLVDVGPGDEALALQEADGGVVRLRAGEPFPQEASALWLAVQSLAFTLVCEPHENLLLAEGTLRGLTRHCLEHLHMLGPGSEVLLKSSRVDVLLSRLLPHGQLLFLNHRFLQSLEKETAAYMAK